MMEDIKKIAVPKLRSLFPGYKGHSPKISKNSLKNWKIENDAPILKFLFKAHQPRRHLEFGTWEGWGTSLCLECCPATVWTINLPDGEERSDGTWAYGQRVLNKKKSPPHIVSVTFGKDKKGPINYHRTDAGGYIGHLYREKGLGPRVCQIYCDSREWDTSNYPPDFFDSVFIDGGHQTEVVVSDTRKALEVLRRGGLILWHDYCPLPEIRSEYESIKAVTEGIELLLPRLQVELKNFRWINPSLILMGIKK
jgi:predicted O-methyltransferase YrrM